MVSLDVLLRMPSNIFPGAAGGRGSFKMLSVLLKPQFCIKSFMEISGIFCHVVPL